MVSRRLSNAGSNRTAVFSHDDESAAYDSLPKRARLALANARFKWSAVELREYFDAHEINLRSAASFIDEQDRLLASRTRVETWGDLYPSDDSSSFDRFY